ncbi:hypothetical protein QWY69_021325 [Klebsiella aerogenes]|uniref:hypothetical protein n=1 Tax=Klebsiella aerogenes TaxID=548 RepID=UPI001CC379BE|nr:hypothetical protein [Klebsiella aerogenes]MDN3793988.1 hypothetical protein [Klebsiella aerogenes]UNX73316.1 hypothetical protein MQE09_21830 [Klebsiella aerogenes]
MSSESTEIGFNGRRFLLSFVIFVYIMTYTLFSIKYLFLSWAGDYAFLNDLIHASDSFVANEEMKLAIFTIIGALFGGATLGITSLHKYSAVTKKLDIDHLWGYLMAPILSIVIGILIFCLLYSGIIVLNGGASINTAQTSVKIGYLSLGAICSYNWDVFVMKLQKLSKHVSDE